MVVTTTSYVNKTVIMTMTATSTMIMTMVATKAMIMTIIATTTMTKSTTLTKNITGSMTAVFKQVQKDNFYCLLKMIKKVMKIKFPLLL